mgnify:CR=1 FL=1
MFFRSNYLTNIVVALGLMKEFYMNTQEFYLVPFNMRGRPHLTYMRGRPHLTCELASRAFMYSR